MIEIAGLLAFATGCAVCARLGYMRGRVVGENIAIELQRGVLDEAEKVMRVSEEAHRLIGHYQDLFEKARPILEEHTWHKTRAKK